MLFTDSKIYLINGIYLCIWADIYYWFGKKERKLSECKKNIYFRGKSYYIATIKKVKYCMFLHFILFSYLKK